MKTKLPRLFQSVSDSDLLVTEEKLSEVLCSCGGDMATSKEGRIYMPDHNVNKLNITLKCQRCSQSWRFTEILPFDYVTAPLSVSLSYYLRDFKFWLKDNTGRVVMFAIALWLIALYMDSCTI